MKDIVDQEYVDYLIKNKDNLIIEEVNPYQDQFAGTILRSRLRENNIPVDSINYFSINGDTVITTFIQPKLGIRCFVWTNKSIKSFHGLFTLTHIMKEMRLNINNIDEFYDSDSIPIPYDEMELFQTSTVKETGNITWEFIEILNKMLNFIQAKADNTPVLSIIDSARELGRSIKSAEMEYLRKCLTNAENFVIKPKVFFKVQINDAEPQYKYFISNKMTEEQAHDLLMEDGEYSWIADTHGSVLTVLEITKQEFEQNSGY